MKKIIFKKEVFTFSLVFSLFLGASVSAQDKVWTLEECISYALENNIQIQQSELNQQISKQDLVASRYNILPSANASASHTYNFGQTIDPFTNQFANSQVRSNSLSVSSSLTLFNGFRNVNTIKRNQAQLKAAEYDLQKMKNDISLNIANSYLGILFNEELLKNAESQLRVTQGQIDRIDKQVKAGVLAEGALKDIEAQFANEELQVINAQNQLKLSKLNLEQMLRLESAEEFEIVSPSMDNFQSVSELVSPGVLYLTALQTMPEIKSAEYGVYSAEKSVQISRSGYLPSLSMTGSLGSGFSQNNKEFIDNELKVKPFTNQLDDNFNKSVSFRLSIPIFNGLSARTNVRRAKLQAQSAQLAYDNAQLVLRQNIESAHNDAVAGLKRYRAAEKSVSALTTSFNYTQERFNVGIINSFDFNNEKNRLNNAQSELLQAKYNYIFSTKVLDFYQGKAISFTKK
ncbi:MAG: TolC family protein [Flavobacteriales bacterium]|nr:TolC family protein [Flavobacteriales bacterium]